MYDAYIVKRTQIYLDAEQARQIAGRARAAGETRSTVIREAIERYLAAPDEASARLARFREALDAFELHRLDLPDGAAYVEAIRAADEGRESAHERRRA